MTHLLPVNLYIVKHLLKSSGQFRKALWMTVPSPGEASIAGVPPGPAMNTGDGLLVDDQFESDVEIETENLYDIVHDG